jgi:hypothetical protein
MECVCVCVMEMNGKRRTQSIFYLMDEKWFRFEHFFGSLCREREERECWSLPVSSNNFCFHSIKRKDGGKYISREEISFLNSDGEKNCMYLSIVREIVSWSHLRGSYWRNFSALFVMLYIEREQKSQKKEDSSAGNGTNMYARVRAYCIIIYFSNFCFLHPKPPACLLDVSRAMCVSNVWIFEKIAQPKWNIRTTSVKLMANW